jgi:hypothetical protein
MNHRLNLKVLNTLKIFQLYHSVNRKERLIKNFYLKI